MTLIVPLGAADPIPATDAVQPCGDPVNERLVRDRRIFQFLHRDDHRVAILAALVVGHDAFLNTRQKQIIELAAESRLPTVYATRGAVMQGGLMSYGVPANVTNDLYRLAGIYAGRILNGEIPPELPITLPARFEFVINRTTANTMRVASGSGSASTSSALATR